MERPDYIFCIVKAGTESLCGERSMDFKFQSVEHAEMAVEQGSRLVPCEECLSKATKE